MGSMCEDPRISPSQLKGQKPSKVMVCLFARVCAILVQEQHSLSTYHYLVSKELKELCLVSLNFKKLSI